MTDFDLQVCRDCYRSTGDKDWTSKVSDWFYRMDFIPSNWKDDYLEFCRNYL